MSTKKEVINGLVLFFAPAFVVAVVSAHMAFILPNVPQVSVGVLVVGAILELLVVNYRMWAVVRWFNTHFWHIGGAWWVIIGWVVATWLLRVYILHLI